MKKVFKAYIECITDTNDMGHPTYHLLSIILILFAFLFSISVIFAPWMVNHGLWLQVTMTNFYSSIGNFNTIYTILEVSTILSIIFYIATWIAYVYKNEKLMLIYGILWRVLSGFILVEIIFFILIGIICDVMPFIFYKLPNRLFSKKEEKVYEIDDNWHTKQVSYSEYMNYKLNETINELNKFIKEK